MEWTAEQEKAITFRGGAAIVSAAAGSGKTAVLVERVKRLILDEDDPVNADEMVISTFTNKAADEMKTRLEKAIEEELAKAPDNRRLIEQRLRLNDASISTISSFCLELLRRHSAEAGLPPDISVLDESEAALMQSRALTDVLEEFCEPENADKRDLLYDWFADKDDTNIAKTIRYMYNYSRNIPDADSFFAEQLEAFRFPEKLSEKNRKNLEEFTERYIKKAAENLKKTCDIMSASAEPQAVSFSAEWKQLADMALSFAAEWKRLSDMGLSPEVSVDGLKKAATPTMPRKTTKFDNADLKEYAPELKKMWESIVRSAGLLSRREDDMRACAPVLAILIELVKALESRFSAMKLEKGRVDFSDIELMTLKMLRDENGEPSDTAKEIAKSAKVIIVDEFQDSNDVQYEIFRLISDNKKNLYFVGDIKQSIYRFRGADPLVFARLTKDPDFTVIDLNRNFRSCKEVIGSANGIFTDTMTEELGDVNYDESCALVQGMPYDTDEKNRTELITFRGSSVGDARRSEAAYIADRIKNMVLSGFTVGNGDKKHPCNYSDFAVLMGKYSNHIGIYKSAFEKAGIPYKAKEDGGYTDNEEIRHVLALLRVIDDPYRDTDLAPVLMKEPFMFTADEMAQIKLAGGVKRDSLWAGLFERAKEDAHAAEVLAEINGYRDFAADNSPERLLRKIFDESLLIPAAEASPDGAKRGANLRMLIHYAELFSGGGTSLYDLIKFIESLDKEKIELPQAKGDAAGGNYIQIMTVHGSKGLEFPICFVANVTGTLFYDPDSGVICDRKYGIGMKINDSARMLSIDTLPYELVSAENRRLETSERMRLLYVAATRAKEKLIFTVPLTSRTTSNLTYNWIIGSHAVRDKLMDVSNCDGYMSAEEATFEFREEPKFVIPPFTEYAYEKFTKIPAKVTATQIGVKSVDDFAEYGSRIDRFLRVPTFIGTKETSKLTGKKRGDAYHKVMELLDFTAERGDVPAILDDLFSRGKITEAERACINEDDIARFLESDICRRAAKSGDINREFPIFCEYEPTPEESGVDDWTGEEKPFIQGIADMFFVEDGEIVLVDYKTNTRTTPEMLTEEYKGQLEIYARALSEATGMRVKQKLLYSFELGEVEV